MKKKFRGFCRPTEDEFKTLWKNAVFVFDTNVLLNMYEYPETVYNAFLQFMKSIQSRIWIPYHVGLEFHRNKIKRIKKSNDSLNGLLNSVMGASSKLESDLRNIELEKRNLDVDIEEKITAVRIAYENLSNVVKLACDKLPTVSLDDCICAEIFNVVGDSIGSPVGDQNELDKLIEDVDSRYTSKIPPGFSENKKDVFHHRGILYHNEYGDLIIWRQILNYINDVKIKHLIFVTDDKKDDWWWIKDGKTLGPLPELVEEIYDKTCLEIFWMYSSGQLLEYSKQYIEGGVDVTQETIDRIKDLTRSDSVDDNSEPVNSINFKVQPKFSVDEACINICHEDDIDIVERNILRRMDSIIRNNSIKSVNSASRSISSVVNWIENNNMNDGGCIIESDASVDVIVERKGVKFGYQIVVFKDDDFSLLEKYIMSSILHAKEDIANNKFDEFAMVVIVHKRYLGCVDKLRSGLSSSAIFSLLHSNLVKEITFGAVVDDVFKRIISFHFTV